MLFIHRQIIWPSVNLARARKNNFHVRIVAAASFQDRQLRGCVNVQIGQRVGHRIQMTGLAGEIEQNFSSLNQCGHGVRVTHVRQIDNDAVTDISNIKEVAAMFWNQTVNQRYLCPESNQTPSQGRANEPESTRDKNIRAGKNFGIEDHGGIVGRGQKDFL